MRASRHWTGCAHGDVEPSIRALSRTVVPAWPNRHSGVLSEATGEIRAESTPGERRQNRGSQSRLIVASPPRQEPADQQQSDRDDETAAAHFEDERKGRLVVVVVARIAAQGRSHNDQPAEHEPLDQKHGGRDRRGGERKGITVVVRRTSRLGSVRERHLLHAQQPPPYELSPETAERSRSAYRWTTSLSCCWRYRSAQVGGLPRPRSDLVSVGGIRSWLAGYVMNS